MSEVRTDIRREFRLKMWAGDLEALRHLVAVCRERHSASQDLMRADLSRTAATRRAKWLSTAYLRPSDDVDALWEEANEKEILAATSSVKFNLEIKLPFGETLSGPVEDVVAQISRPEQVQELTISVGSSYAFYGLPPQSGFSLLMSSLGPKVSIFSSDHAWSSATEALLRRELKQQLPWYRWLRSTWASSVLGNGLLTSGYVLTVGPLLSSGTGATDFSRALYWILFIVISAAYIVFVVLIWPKLLPAFDLSSEKQLPKGKRAVGALLGAGVWVVGTVVIPLLIR